MPVHDWTRVSAGTFHDFHLSWIAHLKEALNNGLLPPDYYALAEQQAGEIAPDVLALHAPSAETFPESPPDRRLPGAVAVAEAPPEVRLALSAEAAFYTERRRTLVVRHASDDRIIALIEIVSPGNKSGRRDVGRFVDKALAALDQGYHLLVVDLFPPGRLDPCGLSGLVWRDICGEEFQLPPDKRLALASFVAARTPRVYVEPFATGDALPEMPLFLDPAWYINVPLERTYGDAWRGVPERWRRVIEGTL
ncbi:MAG: DUF4058 family protein [Planctomycetaceae bacterium]